MIERPSRTDVLHHLGSRSDVYASEVREAVEALERSGKLRSSVSGANSSRELVARLSAPSAKRDPLEGLTDPPNTQTPQAQSSNAAGAVPAGRVPRPGATGARPSAKVMPMDEPPPPSYAQPKPPEHTSPTSALPAGAGRMAASLPRQPASSSQGSPRMAALPRQPAGCTQGSPRSLQPTPMSVHVPSPAASAAPPTPAAASAPLARALAEAAIPSEAAPRSSKGDASTAHRQPPSRPPSRPPSTRCLAAPETPSLSRSTTLTRKAPLLPAGSMRQAHAPSPSSGSQQHLRSLPSSPSAPNGLATKPSLRQVTPAP